MADFTRDGQVECTYFGVEIPLHREISERQGPRDDDQLISDEREFVSSGGSQRAKSRDWRISRLWVSKIETGVAAVLLHA